MGQMDIMSNKGELCSISVDMDSQNNKRLYIHQVTSQTTAKVRSSVCPTRDHHFQGNLQVSTMKCCQIVQPVECRLAFWVQTYQHLVGTHLSLRLSFIAHH